MFKYYYYYQGQRTVYRLTLVKSMNVEELESYARLVEIGTPDFIEIKVRNQKEKKSASSYKNPMRVLCPYRESLTVVLQRVTP